MSEQKATPGRERITTTHAGWGAGHPRLHVRSDHDRYVHEITTDLTRVGSADDNEIVLPGADALHATITHDATDEYVLTMFGTGETNAGHRDGPEGQRHLTETLRTGAHFTAGGWRLVFARDEFADHGRPYGGRQGGEFAHQRRQGPRPDYTPMGGLSDEQVILIEQVVHGAENPAFEFYVVKDEKVAIYNAMVGETEIGGLSYNMAGEDRLVLLELSVFPMHRKQGIATELIRRVLDDVRAHRRTVIVLCPIVHSFIGRHPEYADLVVPDEAA